MADQVSAGGQTTKHEANGEPSPLQVRDSQGRCPSTRHPLRRTPWPTLRSICCCVLSVRALCSLSPSPSPSSLSLLPRPLLSLSLSLPLSVSPSYGLEAAAAPEAAAYAPCGSLKPTPYGAVRLPRALRRRRTHRLCRSVWGAKLRREVPPDPG
jgi:hypothetical protein